MYESHEHHKQAILSQFEEWMIRKYNKGQAEKSPTIESSVINPPYGPIQHKQSNTPVRAIGRPRNGASNRKTNEPTNREYSGWHTTRAEKQISSEALRLYLKGKGSPLAEFSNQILASPYWSTIIGICTIEQYGCTRGPSFNLWGIMSGRGGLAKYNNYDESIQAISTLLAKYESRSKDTIEELNGYYVVPASSNWLNIVIKIKQLVESL